MKKIMVVEDFFIIKGRGLVAVGMPEEGASVVMNEGLTIIRPDGVAISTSVNGLEFISTVSSVKKLGILLFGITDKNEIPVGSTLFSV